MRSRRRTAGALAAFAVLIVGGAIRSATIAEPAGGAPNVVDISIVEFEFLPATVSAAPGDTVRFRNNGSATHQVVAADDSFDSGPVEPGQTFSVIAGETPIPYSCARHENMTGTIAIALVGTASTTAASTTTTATTTTAPTNTVGATATTASQLAFTGADESVPGAVGVAAVALGIGALVAQRRRRPRTGASFDGHEMLPGRDRDRRALVRRPPAEF